MVNHDNVMWMEKEIVCEDDGDICFKPVAKVVRKPRFIALDTALANQPVIVSPVDIDTSEAAMMVADLMALRTGEVEPVVTMDTETLNAIESEVIGAEFSTMPYSF